MILLKIYRAIILTRVRRTILAVKVFLLRHYKLGSAIFSCLRSLRAFQIAVYVTVKGQWRIDKGVQRHGTKIAIVAKKYDYER